MVVSSSSSACKSLGLNEKKATSDPDIKAEEMIRNNKNPKANKIPAEISRGTKVVNKISE